MDQLTSQFQRTRAFWLEQPQYKKSLWAINRRLIRSSRTYFLFNDMLVTMQVFSSQQYLLTTLWVEDASDNTRFAIKLSTPEESFEVIAQTAKDKDDWLQAFCFAISSMVESLNAGYLIMRKRLCVNCVP